jgi:hypothetical protein
MSGIAATTPYGILEPIKKLLDLSQVFYEKFEFHRLGVPAWPEAEARMRGSGPSMAGTGKAATIVSR